MTLTRVIQPVQYRALLRLAASSSSPFQMTVDYSTKQKYASLPKLPVPDPKNTLQKFLQFAQPLQSKAEFKHTSEVVNSFAQNELPKLQALLEERARNMNNWLTPWWLDVAYLQARTPLPVVTSPGVLFPRFNFDGVEGQLDYASKLTLSALRFYKKVENDELKQDMAGKAPFDMSQYKYLFGTTRIPRKGCDEIRYGVSNENKSRHIIVMKGGNAFYVPVLDKNYQPLNYSTIHKSFKDVAAGSSENKNKLGVISSDNRDKWAAVYLKLEADPKNAKNLRLIEDALFVVCLDELTDPPHGYTEKDEQGRQALHGGGYKHNSGNRWFDKTMQFLVAPNGLASMTYEHTPAEGPPLAALMDFICDDIENHGKDVESQNSSSDAVQRLDFNLNEDIIKQIEKSAKKIDAVAKDVELVAHTFNRFGKNFPKKVKISPDSFIQLAFQLSFYRIHNTLPPTYETATLRKFDEGRTENIRSPNPKTEIFIKKMATGRTPVADVYDALKAATEEHKKYTVDCMNGAGMDRHLLAWNLLAAENGLPKPSILETPAYDQMSHFQVSTSQVPTRNFIQMCFGPSAPDCYGICYNPQETELHFMITSFRSCGSTSSKKFASELSKALTDMSAVCSKALKEQSKL